MLDRLAGRKLIECLVAQGLVVIGEVAHCAALLLAYGGRCQVRGHTSCPSAQRPSQPAKVGAV